MQPIRSKEIELLQLSWSVERIAQVDSKVPQYQSRFAMSGWMRTQIDFKNVVKIVAMNLRPQFGIASTQESFRSTQPLSRDRPVCIAGIFNKSHPPARVRVGRSPGRVN